MFLKSFWAPPRLCPAASLFLEVSGPSVLSRFYQPRFEPLSRHSMPPSSVPATSRARQARLYASHQFTPDSAGAFWSPQLTYGAVPRCSGRSWNPHWQALYSTSQFLSAMPQCSSLTEPYSPYKPNFLVWASYITATSRQYSRSSNLGSRRGIPGYSCCFRSASVDASTRPCRSRPRLLVSLFGCSFAFSTIDRPR